MSKLPTATSRLPSKNWPANKLIVYKNKLSNMKDINEVNQALKQRIHVNNVYNNAYNNAYNIDSAKSQFEAAKNAIQARQFKAHAISELSEDRGE
ncbi:MAG: hypothetical protein ACUVRV_06055 [Cyanobacteriota bacterium]